MKINILHIIVLFILLSLSTKAISQNCSKKKIAEKEIKEDYDYRGQSLYKDMLNGESAELHIVLYSKQNYRLFVAGEQKLGEVDYQIIVPRKQFTRVVKEIVPKTVTEYRKDPSGFFLYDTDGQRIPEGEKVIQDTIWERKTTEIEELVYDSRTNELPYWTATPRKTQQIKVLVEVKPAHKPESGCVGIYVGKEYTNTYQFRR